MNSGKIVDLRDQVFITSPSFATSAFLNKFSSTNGPFFNDLAMSSILLPYFLALRFLTISFSDGFLVFLVLTPRAFLPHGVTGLLRPIGVRPSPPPCG